MHLSHRLLTLFLFVGSLSFSQTRNSSWKAVLQEGKGTLIVYWFDNNPFTFQDDTGKLRGLEVEIVQGFQEYVKKHYNIPLSIEWRKLSGFPEIIQQAYKNEAGSFVLGGLSINEERRQFVQFSPPYLADIAVLVSTEDIPLVKSEEDFSNSFMNATAYAIPGTLMEEDLSYLREQSELDFKIEPVSNSFEFLDALKMNKKAFGYISLPVYLQQLNNNTIQFKRQNFFTKIKEGHGIAFPLGSDWKEPVESYFASQEFKASHEAIIGSYLNIDLYHFLETFDSKNEVSLLNKEKDIQQRELQLKEFKIKSNEQKQIFLLIGILFVTAFSVIIGIMLRNNLRFSANLKLLNDTLNSKNKEIAEKNEEIQAQSEELTESNTLLGHINNELLRQKEEIAIQNEELIQNNEEISSQRDVVHEQKARLEQAHQIIEHQNRVITLRNESLELEVAERTKELVEYNKQLEQFAFISSHNLRAPVARILGLGQLLDLPGNTEQEKTFIKDKLIFTTQELDHVVKDLNSILDIKHNSSVEITDVDLESVVRSVKNIFEKELLATRTQVLIDFSAVKIIRSFKPYIDSIFFNLFSNAIKYRDPERTLIIKLTTEKQDDFSRLVVEDNGMGIDLKLYRTKLFTLYSRFHTNVEGKGLGLYLIKTQLAALGGRIEVESEVGRGTTFSIYLK